MLTTINLKLMCLPRYVREKYQVCSLQTTIFFTTATTFSIVVSMSNNFLNDFFKRFLAVLCVVIKGLKNNKV